MGLVLFTLNTTQKAVVLQTMLKSSGGEAPISPIREEITKASKMVRASVYEIESKSMRGSNKNKNDRRQMYLNSVGESDASMSERDDTSIVCF